MSEPCGPCSEVLDPHRGPRPGTDRTTRSLVALDANAVPVDDLTPAHRLVVATRYAEHLRYIGLDDQVHGTWRRFFSRDVAALLAELAITDATRERQALRELLGSITDPEPSTTDDQLVTRLGEVFAHLASLARRIDSIHRALPSSEPLRATTTNLIEQGLAANLRTLIGCYLAGAQLQVIDRTTKPPSGRVLGRKLTSFEKLLTGRPLDPAWCIGAGVRTWAEFLAVDPLDHIGLYGPGASVPARIDHLVGHQSFRRIDDALLGAMARIVGDAGDRVAETMAQPGHEPHYALLLAFVQLAEHTRRTTNTFAERHLDLYYRRFLGLSERPAAPARAHVLVELAKHAEDAELARGTLVKAGRSPTGGDLTAAFDRTVVANGARVADLRRTYQHLSKSGLPVDAGRPYATAVPPGTADWHPFVERSYADGALASIDSPPARIGLAIASGHLWLTEGMRTITVELVTSAPPPANPIQAQLTCAVTTEKGWYTVPVDHLEPIEDGLRLTIELDGNAPPITPIDPKVHGLDVGTHLPVLTIDLPHVPGTPWVGGALGAVAIDAIRIQADVQGFKSLSLANDHGLIDASKPFLAFGSTPTADSSLVIGSLEVLGKRPDYLALYLQHMVTPAAHVTLPSMAVEVLDQGQWTPHLEAGIAMTAKVNAWTIELTDPLPATPGPAPVGQDAPLDTSTRSGFLRLRLSSGFGQDTYPAALGQAIAAGTLPLPTAPVLPRLASVTAVYHAITTIDLATQDPQGDRAFHLLPTGHVALDRPDTPVVPRFEVTPGAPAEGELCIGIADAQPRQRVTMLVEVVDGTANPLTVKPPGHLRWSYLRGDDWIPMPEGLITDGTGGLIASGILDVAVPADADLDHDRLPAGLHWIRAAIGSASDAVCRVHAITAQAATVTATSTDVELSVGTVKKLLVPDGRIKGLTQPGPSFGARAVESQAAFTMRVSERLRHRDRAIQRWDQEHLILEAFPEVFQARCLAHTRYEPTPGGAGIYHELAAGHVTIVTIPDLAVPNPIDPLRPTTSLRTLEAIERFIRSRVSCFVELHVRNPQFEEVRVDAKVRFHHGVDEAHALTRLRTDLTRHLSPWAFQADARPTFSARVHRSAIIDFLEAERDVDFVTDVRLYRRLPGAADDGPDLDEVVGSRAVSVLVSAPATHHGIAPLPHEQRLDAERCGCSQVGS